MKDLIERLEAALTTEGENGYGFVAVSADDLRALIAAHKALREAAGALVAEVENTSSHALIGCDYCRTLAMHDNGLYVACDEHRSYLDDEYDVSELSYAAPLRALRAALKEGP